MEFMSAREAADKWGISQRRVAILCSEGRIDEAVMVGNMWSIPNTANFTAYSENEFNDEKQIELAEFAKKMSKKGAIVVSNSDHRGVNLYEPCLE
ncbi:hypothetical protein [Anaerotignum sp. MSJ-24]|uniref:hypothetical protein n=1 Tax=Anaerotignum sp. MSJ-24 TaxID=2841521 RepID=UPI002ED4832D